MVATAAGTEVGAHGETTAGVVAGVVQVAAARGAAAARVAAGAIPDLHVAGQGGAGESVVRAAVEGGEQGVADGELAGDVGDHGGPGCDRQRCGGLGGLIADQLDELGELVGADLQLHDPAGASPDRRLGTRRDARPAARHPGQEQVTVRIDDGEAPLRTPLLARHEIPGDPGQHGSEPGELAGPLVEPDERGQADPDLDTGRCCSRAPAWPVAGPASADSSDLPSPAGSSLARSSEPCSPPALPSEA